ncbi:TPA: hypothetical protein N0F65_006494 [Lagenidium giganteum]|uniref:Uncharacterized protein n=1 Tax=Lagenidium giganteum TaxID=4803 RepID=A0AAV2YSW4_9STRA|nr:TPA: hypothetical protein N0F65_006494 [Lagenidium giganteum]
MALDGSAGSQKRKYAADPEHVVMSEFLRDIEVVDDNDGNTRGADVASHSDATWTHGRVKQKRPRTSRGADADARSTRARGSAREAGSSDVDDEGLDEDDADAPGGRQDGDGDDDNQSDDKSDKSDKSSRPTTASSRHTKLTELEQHVRQLERDNLHLKQTLLLGKKGSMMLAAGGGGPGAGSVTGTGRDSIHELLAERTKIVQEMVQHLNSPFLSLGDAARVWHQDCRVGVGVREWDAFGRLQTISLWNMIRSVFATMAVDIVELRPHLPDGEMILTKWRIQGEIAAPAQLKAVCSSEDCPPTMKVALMAIKSSDLTFTVTTYVIFQESRIAEQHHCWDQVGVFKRLFGGEIPPSVVKILTIH